MGTRLIALKCMHAFCGMAVWVCLLYVMCVDEPEMSEVPTVSNVRQDLSEWQARHATLVLSTVKETLTTTPVSKDEVKETKPQSKASSSKTDHDLDVFLLGDLGSEDDGPDVGDDGSDDDFDKIGKSGLESDEDDGSEKKS
ncbi:hypothetical protein J5N97_005162 [Dioscorea zingiberensis]|uniref:Uncharacterized protein n=1 Tax=Dioscorea zingiberensis TaxID=325984 RepID=A0A9D5HSG8_9LILI|nr:hypothetical protein J5N97_005162 [Dioscorea zingiberensis]